MSANTPSACSRSTSTHRLPEDDLDVVHRLGRFDEEPVQAGARHGVDDVMRLVAVRLERQAAVDRMHHAAAHRNRDVEELFLQPDTLERGQTAGRDREVDRSPAARGALARIRAALVDLDPMSRAPEKHGRQRAAQTRADDRDGLRRGAHGPAGATPTPAASRTAWATRRLKTEMS